MVFIVCLFVFIVIGYGAPAPMPGYGAPTGGYGVSSIPDPYAQPTYGGYGGMPPPAGPTGFGSW